MLTEKDVECLHVSYQIPQNSFKIYAPHYNVQADDHVPIEDIVIVYED